MNKASKEIMLFWKTQWEAYMKSMLLCMSRGRRFWK